MTASRPTLSRAADGPLPSVDSIWHRRSDWRRSRRRGSRERNQEINLGEKFDEIAGPNRACFHEVLMRVARIASAHEYVHHIMNMNLGLFEGQMRGSAKVSGPRT